MWQRADLDHVRDFYFSHYAPNNAILTLAGKITYDRAFRLANEWFGPLPKGKYRERNLPAEPVQEAERSLTVERDVPADALYKVWHIGPRNSPDFHTLDLITDLLAGGESGRLYTSLVRKRNYSVRSMHI